MFVEKSCCCRQGIYLLIILGILFMPLEIQAVLSSKIYAERAKSLEIKVIAEGQSQWKKGKLERALSILEEIVNLDPSNKQTAKIFKSMQMQKKRIDGLLKEASDLIDKRDYEEAKKSLQKASYISESYPKYQKVLQKFSETKKKDAEKVANARQKRIALLFASSKSFQEIASRNYTKALLTASKEIGKLQLYSIDMALWNKETSQIGWMTFFNSAVRIYNKDLDGLPIVGYYNPYSDTLLITVWSEDNNIYKIVDAEMIMGDLLRTNVKLPSHTPVWLREKQDYRAALGANIAYLTLDFENIFSSSNYKTWRKKLKILNTDSSLNDLNYSGVSVMVNSHLLNILNFINPEINDLLLKECHDLAFKVIKFAGSGNLDILSIAKMTPAKTIKLLKEISPKWFRILKISAVISDAKGYFVFLTSPKQTNFSIVFTIKKGINDSNLNIDRIDLIDYQHFFDLLNLQIEKNQKGGLQ